jgi:ankyrin repeat protein
MAALLKQGANPDAVDPHTDGAPAIYVALGWSSAPEGSEDDEGFIHDSPNNQEMVRLLLDHGANANARTGQGTTPLIAATHIRDIDSIQLLLERGADVNAYEEGGYTALMAASSFDLVEYFEGYARILTTLLEAGANVNFASSDGWTALMCAALYAGPRTVKILLEKGSDVWARNKLGETGYDIALDRNYEPKPAEVRALLRESMTVA